MHRPTYALYEVNGPINTTLLAEALTLVVRKFSVLRSSFRQDGDDWIVSIRGANAVNCELRIIDGSNLDSSTIATIIRREVFLVNESEDAHAFRAVLIMDTKEQRSQLLICASHLIMDGRSASIIAHEIASQYSSEPSREIPECFYDFAFRQRAALDEGSLHSSMQFWKECISTFGVWPRVSIPTLLGRSEDHLVPAASVTSTIRRDEWTSFHLRCQEMGVTHYCGLLAAALCAIRELGGEQDNDFGVVVILSGRSWPGCESIPGFFSNNASLGVGKIPQSWDATAVQVQSQVSSLIKHDVIPRDEIVRRLGRAEDAAPMHPYVFFDFERTHDERHRLDEFTTMIEDQSVEVDIDVRRYPGIFLVVREDGDGGGILRCEYGIGEFDPKNAEGLVSEWAGTIRNQLLNGSRIPSHP
jgi:hypothetical protein